MAPEERAHLTLLRQEGLLPEGESLGGRLDLAKLG